MYFYRYNAHLDWKWSGMKCEDILSICKFFLRILEYVIKYKSQFSELFLAGKFDNCTSPSPFINYLESNNMQDRFENAIIACNLVVF